MIPRRAFLATIVIGLSAGAVAQPARLPVIGFLNSQSPIGWERFIDAFLDGLHQSGFDRGRNVSVEFRWAEGQNERLSRLSAELVAQGVQVIVATGGPDPVLAAKAATSSVPVVFTTGPDPVGLGLVNSLARPGGNLTGFTLFTFEIVPKRVELLHELAPGARNVAILVNPDSAGAMPHVTSFERAATARQLAPVAFHARREGDFEPAFAAMSAARIDALYIASDAFFFAHRRRLTALAEKHRLPTSYEAREMAEAGGLISFGPNFAEVYRRAGVYAARILKGESPAELPVQQPEKFELVVNLKAARAIGLAIEPALLAQTDEVIE